MGVSLLKTTRVLACAILALACATAFAQPGSLAVHVVTAEGEPVADATGTNTHFQTR